MDEKRNIDGYEEKFSFQLAGRLVILAENTGADKPFLVCCARWDNPFGAEVYYDSAVMSDYLDAVRKFIKQEAVLLDALDLQRGLSSLPFRPMTVADCVPGGMDEDIKGKLVVIKPEVLSPEYRSMEHQLGICRGGFGSRPGSSGTAVFIDKLFNGETSRFERSDIAGVADAARLPECAKARFAELGSACANSQSPNEVSKGLSQPAENVVTVSEKKSKQSEADKNAACAASIDKAIQASYQGEYRYDLKTAIKTVMEEFGARRVAAVLAANIVDAEYDGRFSVANKTWARNFYEQAYSGDTPLHVVVNTHKAILDGFVTKFRNMHENVQNRKPTVHGLMDSAKQEIAVAQNSVQRNNYPKSHGIEK